MSEPVPEIVPCAERYWLIRASDGLSVCARKLHGYYSSSLRTTQAKLLIL